MYGITFPLWNVNSSRNLKCVQEPLPSNEMSKIRSIYYTEQINYCRTISRFDAFSTQTESQTRCWKQTVKKHWGTKGILRYLSADPECVRISTVNPHYHSAPILQLLFNSMKSDVLLSLRGVYVYVAIRVLSSGNGIWSSGHLAAD